MKKIIIDCDNTFGVAGCDVDDGLAIIYAFGSGKCQILGITTTFGNNTLDVVYPNTISFMKRIGCEDVPVLKGCKTSPKQNKAAEFLVDMANKYQGEISILATGSLTNLYHAYLLDNDFFAKTVEISLMGGITSPLVICGKNLKELNFSCDCEASYNVLTKAYNIKIATGNNCLSAFFEREDFSRLCVSHNILTWLYNETVYWFEREKKVFGHNGIYKWDVYAAAALLNPEFFSDIVTGITPDKESLESGFLLGKGETVIVNLPEIKNKTEYMKHVYDTYNNFGKQREGNNNA